MSPCLFLPASTVKYCITAVLWSLQYLNTGVPESKTSVSQYDRDLTECMYSSPVLGDLTGAPVTHLKMCFQGSVFSGEKDFAVLSIARNSVRHFNAQFRSER